MTLLKKYRTIGTKHVDQKSKLQLILFSVFKFCSNTRKE